MKIRPLSTLDDGSAIAADLVVIGGGPVGLAIAAECAGSGRRVVVVESGVRRETPGYAALNRLESVGEPGSPEQWAKRAEFHGHQAGFWSHEAQPYGVRCRVLGGSTQAWAGKSAPFDAIDFQARSWVPNSGWPLEREDILPYLGRALDLLNLSPQEPEARFGEGGLHSFYWQFARSRVDRLDVMRFGRDFIDQAGDNVEVLLDASVKRIGLAADGSRFSCLDVESLDGRRARIEASLCVVAAGGIENARLLLASNDVHARGIGNGHDAVGRYLMDHVGTCLGDVPEAHIASFYKLFGFYSVRRDRRSHMFMHGLALTPEVQEREALLNASLYFSPQHARDDPWDALKRLIRLDSPMVGRDLLALATGSGCLLKGVGMRLVASGCTPQVLKDLIVNTAIRLSPNMVADEFQSRGLPHKLTALRIEAISEQVPDAESRIVLGTATDRLGVPLAQARWKIGEAERGTLLRIAELAGSALTRAGLPAPIWADWVREGRPQDGVVIDMAHTMGTTRMSANAKTGVVDRDCRVHGLPNLYVAGGSVFPTSGHANPTLMFLALALRLADHLKGELARLRTPFSIGALDVRACNVSGEGVAE